LPIKTKDDVNYLMFPVQISVCFSVFLLIQKLVKREFACNSDLNFTQISQ